MVEDGAAGRTPGSPHPTLPSGGCRRPGPIPLSRPHPGWPAARGLLLRWAHPHPVPPDGPTRVDGWDVPLRRHPARPVKPRSPDDRLPHRPPVGRHHPSSSVSPAPARRPTPEPRPLRTEVHERRHLSCRRPLRCAGRLARRPPTPLAPAGDARPSLRVRSPSSAGCRPLGGRDEPEEGGRAMTANLPGCQRHTRRRLGNALVARTTTDLDRKRQKDPNGGPFA